MSAVDDLVSANDRYARAFRGGQAARPGKRLAIVTCMDTRIDPLGAFGLVVGDAHVIRNAGGLATDDVLRSLVISQRALGTCEIALVHHTQCGMAGFDDDAFRAQLAEESGEQPPWQVAGFDDVRAQMSRSLALVRNCPWLPERDQVRGFVLEVALGRLYEVTSARPVPGQSVNPAPRSGGLPPE